MRRNILAYIAGIVVAFATISLVQLVGHQIYPPPDGLTPQDKEAFAAFVASLPVGALLFPACSYIVGTFAGGMVAARIGLLKPVYFASTITSLVLAATIANLMMIPHPLWFIPVSLLGIVGAGAAATLLSRGRTE